MSIMNTKDKGEEEYIKCPKCHSELIRLNGLILKSDGRRVQRFQCKDCGYSFTLERKKRKDKS